SNAYLYAAGVVAPNDIWAVGEYFPVAPSSWAHTLVEHWDGTSWTQVPSPSPNIAWLYGIAAISANDIWAVGQLVSQTLTQHWDGSSWSVVPSPNPGSTQNALKGVAVVSANDVWAVGEYSSAPCCMGPNQTLVEHWDGAQWRVVSTPSPGTARFYGVVA